MQSRSWRRGFLPVCATISLLVGRAAAATPALALVDAAEAGRWQAALRDAGWKLIVPAPADTPDARVRMLQAAVAKAIAEGADPARIYLAGRGAGAAAVFYTISRTPDLWAAALALDGSPQAAVETGLIFTANFASVPVLATSAAAADQAVAAHLNQLGMHLEWRSPGDGSERAALDWLAPHRHDAFPAQIDCETNSAAFAHCHWVEVTQFDPGERNDMLGSTRLERTLRPALALGAFRYRAEEAGPGVLIAGLPDRYAGPLKVGDRIVELEGRPIADAHAYIEMMGTYPEEKAVVAMVERGKQRLRLETRVVLPPREFVVTARLQARFVPEDREIQIVSRAVTEMRVTIPPAWAGGTSLVWNGLALARIDRPGCVVLSEVQELLHAAPCP